MIEQTLMLVKPDGVRARHIGGILSRVETAGFFIRGMKMIRLQQETAGQFYDIHQEKPFFKDLLGFMTSDRIVAVALEGEDAVAALRRLVGDTDSAKAAPGTIRAEFGSNKQENAVHASDSPENAAREISFFFSREELVSANASGK